MTNDQFAFSLTLSGIMGRVNRQLTWALIFTCEQVFDTTGTDGTLWVHLDKPGNQSVPKTGHWSCVYMKHIECPHAAAYNTKGHHLLLNCVNPKCKSIQIQTIFSSLILIPYITKVKSWSTPCQDNWATIDDQACFHSSLSLGCVHQSRPNAWLKLNIAAIGFH